MHASTSLDRFPQAPDAIAFPPPLRFDYLRRISTISVIAPLDRSCTCIPPFGPFAKPYKLSSLFISHSILHCIVIGGLSIACTSGSPPCRLVETLLDLAAAATFAEAFQQVDTDCHLGV
jgi:hypothetical protein